MIFKFDVDGDGDLDLMEFQHFLESELQALQAPDTTSPTSPSSPSSPSSPVGRARATDGDRRAGRSNSPRASPRAGTGLHATHPPSGKNGQGGRVPPICTCAHYKAHGVCGHVDPSLSEVEKAAVDKLDFDPVFATQALQAQAEIEGKIGGSHYKR